MFQGDGDPADDEVCDAFGELTNMVAGNIKALLPAPSSISLPTVAFGSHYDLIVVGTEPVQTAAFTTTAGGRALPLVVSLLQRTECTGGAPR
jgi:chemotaxis protein CheX